jgi:two-component system, OmpR family, response regulator RegX3
LIQEQVKIPDRQHPYRHTSGMQVLLVEDDAALATVVAEALGSAGHQVERVATGGAALAARDFELVLLDLGLPDLDGRDVCRELRQRDPELMIVIVSAAGAEMDRILGFELGADDYLVKPFSVRELQVRVRALARRAGRERPAETAQAIGRVRLDRRARKVSVDGVDVHFTTKEFDVLAYLCEDAGAVRTRAEIIEHVWGGHWFGPTKTLDAHVAAIRRKLDGAVAVTALRGVGFRVDALP